MSTPRPTVAPELVAALIDATPDRVRRRLDRDPDAATAWTWQATERAWAVAAGAETVTLPLVRVSAVEEVRCTCLLSPRCFHVLACLTRLEAVIVESAPVLVDAPAARETADDVVTPDERQLQAARRFADNLGQLLRVGAANAGVVVQSGLLRATHQCRAEGLHRLAALGLRISTGIREVRARTPAADPVQLAEDMADALETSCQLLGPQAVAAFWIGTARRQQLAVRPRKLHGLFAEPILTRSGFAGAAAYFLGEDDRIYTASDVRPGDAQHARNAYRGGIEIGPLIQPAQQLARSLYLGTDLTASLDGRLGRGKGVQLVEQGASTWQAGPIQARFQRALSEQWNAVYAQAALPADVRPAGWDFLFLTGTILGAVGPHLLLQPTAGAPPIWLAIENDSDVLGFRENLRMLSHAPGLRLAVIARVLLQEPRRAAALAAAPAEGAGQENEPRLEMPESLAGRVCLGFDEIQRHYLANAQASALVLGERVAPPEKDNPLASLRRRWLATALSGIAAQRVSASGTTGAEAAHLRRSGFSTGAALLNALCHGSGAKAPHFLAAALYLRSCSWEIARFMTLARES